MIGNNDLEKVLKTFENMSIEEYEKLYKVAETREPIHIILDDLQTLEQDSRRIFKLSDKLFVS